MPNTYDTYTKTILVMSIKLQDMVDFSLLLFMIDIVVTSQWKPHANKVSRWVNTF